MIVFHDRVQSKVAPTDPDDLVRLRDLGTTDVIAALIALGFIIEWDNGDTEWDNGDVVWRA